MLLLCGCGAVVILLISGHCVVELLLRCSGVAAMRVID